MNYKNKKSKPPSQIDGWMDNIEIGYLRTFIRNCLPQNCIVVELGSYKGKSTVVWGTEIRKKEGKVIAVDTHIHSEKIEYTGSEFLDNVYLSELVRTVIPIFGRFEEVAKFFNYDIDALFIDGNHTYESVKKDFECWNKFIKNNGWLIFHDYNMLLPGVVKFCKELQLNNKNFVVDKRVGSLLFLKCVRGEKDAKI